MTSPSRQNRARFLGICDDEDRGALVHWLQQNVHVDRGFDPKPHLCDLGSSPFHDESSLPSFPMRCTDVQSRQANALDANERAAELAAEAIHAGLGELVVIRILVFHAAIEDFLTY
jgi:hypothetical protein